MIRHTGDYLLGTVFLGAALILQLAQAHTRSVSHPTASPERAAGADNGFVFPTTPWNTLSPVPRQPSTAVHAMLTNLKRGTRIVVGSLDMSGTRHQIRLTSSDNSSPNDQSLAVARFTMENIRRQQGPEIIRSLSSLSRTGLSHQFIQTAAYDLPPDNARISSDISRAVFHQTSNVDSADDALVTCDVNTSAVTPPEIHPLRVFLMPHFADNGTRHTPGDCRVIGESHGVRVYVDQNLPQSSSIDQMQSWSELLLTAVELRALPMVEKWIGPVCDVDHNQKLAIVVTHLDQHQNDAADRSPIFGCIRESDFCPESDFCGDIVYVDQNIFDLPFEEVNALLAHELVHAAICSRGYDGTFDNSLNSQGKTPLFTASATQPVPSWLNEAIAHFVELQCSDASNNPSKSVQEIITVNFQRRIDAFLAGPGCSPIVAADNVLNLEERRGGSRGAATLFLAPLISTPRDLQMLLRTDDALQDRIELLAQQPFADVFRTWTLRIASNSSDSECLRVESIPSDFETKHCSLLGTAFHCFECSEDIATLVFASDEAAQLQISVIEPAVRNTHIAQSKP